MEEQPCEFEVYGLGVCYASVCTSLPVEEAAERLNLEHPTGVPSRWKVNNEPFACGTENPCTCPDHPKTHMHYLFSC